MAPKNKKKTGFYYYMKHMQEKEAARGVHISMSEMPKFAHSMWKDLSAEEKAPYESMAKDRMNDPHFKGKLASDGTSVADNYKEIEELENKKKKMMQDVRIFCNVDGFTEEEFKENVPDKTFYFMSFNILCHTEDDMYIPIEIGIVEYSILNGVHKEYSKLIHTGQIPPGYSGDAKRLSDDKHRISIFDHEHKVAPSLVWRDMKAFLNPDNSSEYPPVFCYHADIELVKGCLYWLAYSAKAYKEDELIDVWSSTYLLMELRAGVGKPFLGEPLAQEMLDKTCFDYHPNTRCEYHDEMDVQNCALGYSKRLCYMLSDAVCDLFAVILTEKHIPPRAIKEKAYEVIVPTIKMPRQNRFATRGIGRGLPIIQPHATAPTRVVVTPQPVLRREPTPEPIPEPEQNTESSRQPTTSSVAEQMRRLQIGVMPAAIPGHGLGRGLRRN